MARKYVTPCCKSPDWREEGGQMPNSGSHEYQYYYRCNKCDNTSDKLLSWEDLSVEFPELYKNAWYGFECAHGWYSLLYDLSKLITEEIKKAEKPEDLYVVQVKEKFGTLRFYMSGYTPEIETCIKAAEEASAKICERCGSHGAILRGTRWLYTSCGPCAKAAPEDQAYHWTKVLQP